jgi:hypothetical protein
MRKHSSPIVWRTALRLLLDALALVSVGFRSRSQLVAENLFLRKQLALYRERRVKPRRADDATRIALVLLSQLIDWRAVLMVVQPATLIRWHRKGLLACDFFVTITATFRTLYVFVVLEVGTRRIVHWNVTEHPTAEWTIQQFRAIVPGDQPQRLLIHDRDSIYAAAVAAPSRRWV